MEIHKEHFFFFPLKHLLVPGLYGKVPLQLKIVTVLPECLGSVTAIAVWGKELRSELDCIPA